MGASGGALTHIIFTLPADVAASAFSMSPEELERIFGCLRGVAAVEATINDLGNYSTEAGRERVYAAIEYFRPFVVQDPELFSSYSVFQEMGELVENAGDSAGSPRPDLARRYILAHVTFLSQYLMQK